MSGLAVLSLPSHLLLPLVQPIISQLLGVWAESYISRTSPMQSFCVKNIKTAQTSTSGWGHWVETKQKGRVDVFQHTTGRKGKWELVCFVFLFQLLHIVGHNLIKVTMSSLQPHYNLHKAIMLCLVLRHQHFFYRYLCYRSILRLCTQLFWSNFL